MKQRFGTAFWLTMILLTVAGIVVIYLNGQRLTPPNYLAPAQQATDLWVATLRANSRLTMTIIYATVGTPMPTARPSNTFSVADNLTADHFRKTGEWAYRRAWLTNDAWATHLSRQTLTALAPTATPTPSPSKTPTATPTSTPTRTPTPPFGGGGDPLCPGGGGEWMWVDGELVFVCGVTWE